MNALLSTHCERWKIMPKISQEKMAIRKRQILDAALYVFSDKGYTQTKVDDIVEYSGISKGGIYTYFDSKEALFIEIANQRLLLRRNLFETLKSELGDQVSIRQLFKKYFYSVLEGLNQPETQAIARFSFEFWSTLSKEKHIKSLALDRYQAFFEDLSKVIKQGIDSEEFHPNLPVDDLCYVILSSLDGMIHTHVVMNIPFNQNAIEAYADAMLSILVGNPTKGA